MLLKPRLAAILMVVAVSAGSALVGLFLLHASRTSRTLTQPAAIDALSATVHLGPATRPVNQRVLGSGIQWVDRGDGILGDGDALNDEALALLKPLGVSVLRYPGGSHSDLFDWRAGEGPLDTRGIGEHFFSGRRQRVLFGTTEFLNLCRALGAEPLITVNTATGTASQAAAWVRAVNDADHGHARGPVRFWELGNEPYLRDQTHPELAESAEDFARKANLFLRAMRRADASVALGLPLRSDAIGGVPIVHVPGFAETVLREVTERFDFVALHNAYFPLLFERKRYEADELFQALMAAYRPLEDDLDYTQSLLRRWRPDQAVPLAITEYSPLFTIGGPFDSLIASPMGALYIADVLRLLAARGDILMANHWSLIGNWHFGALSSELRPRPAYHVLRAFANVLHGQLVDMEIVAPAFDAPGVGAVPATAAVPVVTGIATEEDGRISMLILNKSLRSRVDLIITGRTPSMGRHISARELRAPYPFDGEADRPFEWTDRSVATDGFPIRLDVSPHALTWIEIVESDGGR